MNVKLKYFAWVRERIGFGEEEADLPTGVENVSDTIEWLKKRGEGFARAFEKPEIIRAAVDQVHASHDTPVKGAREIAFFPPVTGG